MLNTVELFRNVCFIVFVGVSVPTFIILINKIKKEK